jgi:hypothetical protein
VTTPSCWGEAQAEIRHAIAKAMTPQIAADFFTKLNLLITGRDATADPETVMLKEGRHEKILREMRSSRLVLHGRQLGRA